MVSVTVATPSGVGGAIVLRLWRSRVLDASRCATVGTHHLDVCAATTTDGGRRPRERGARTTVRSTPRHRLAIANATPVRAAHRAARVPPATGSTHRESPRFRRRPLGWPTHAAGCGHQPADTSAPEATIGPTGEGLPTSPQPLAVTHGPQHGRGPPRAIWPQGAPAACPRVQIPPSTRSLGTDDFRNVEHTVFDGWRTRGQGRRCSPPNDRPPPLGCRRMRPGDPGCQ